MTKMCLPKRGKSSQTKRGCAKVGWVSGGLQPPPRSACFWARTSPPGMRFLSLGRAFICADYVRRSCYRDTDTVVSTDRDRLP